ncbi:hypothetical protein [Rhizobium sp. SG2393]|uniref:hypothetical protein n=1 Tax=Rhizobium sp. SG2393 TaxID=3276279 RepID=UPI00366FE717
MSSGIDISKAIVSRKEISKTALGMAICRIASATTACERGSPSLTKEERMLPGWRTQLHAEQRKRSAWQPGVSATRLRGDPAPRPAHAILSLSGERQCRHNGKLRELSFKTGAIRGSFSRCRRVTRMRRTGRKQR